MFSAAPVTGAYMSFQVCFVFEGFCLSICTFAEVIFFCRPECIRTLHWDACIKCTHFYL